MKSIKEICCLALIAALSGWGTAHAANTGRIRVWLNTNSCEYVTRPSLDKMSMDVELQPVTLEAKYLAGSDPAQRKDFTYWQLDSRESNSYTCVGPKAAPSGGFVEINYFEIYNNVGGFYSHNKLTDGWGNRILSGDRQQVDSWYFYYPPTGFKAFSGWPGVNSYSLRAEAYWLFGGGGQYAQLTINTKP